MPPTIASNVYNPPPLDCDTDYDGFGNLCDGDFNNDAYVDASDFVFFEHDFQPVSAGEVEASIRASAPTWIARVRSSCRDTRHPGDPR
jgi:hypothetical protein